jgi:hypothetical protein
MGSKIKFNNIICSIEKPYNQISHTERLAGKLQAGVVAGKFSSGKKIDVFALKKEYNIAGKKSVTIDEDDIREDSRRVFESLTDFNVKKYRLPVHADFFRAICPGDIVIGILHDK